MGIPVYFKNLINDHNDICFSQNNKLIIDNLLFDLNCLIHPCCREETDEFQMYKKIIDSIDNFFLISPARDPKLLRGHGVSAVDPLRPHPHWVAAASCWSPNPDFCQLSYRGKSTPLLPSPRLCHNTSYKEGNSRCSWARPPTRPCGSPRNILLVSFRRLRTPVLSHQYISHRGTPLSWSRAASRYPMLPAGSFRLGIQ